MNQSRSKVNQKQIEWRHDKVLQLAANGYTGREIASQLHISQPTIHRDLVTLRQQAKEHIRKYIDQRVPFEYQKTLAGLEGIIKNMSNIISTSPDNEEIMKASSIKMQAYNLRMEMVSSANLVHEAIVLAEKYRGYTTQKDNVSIEDGNGKSS